MYPLRKVYFTYYLNEQTSSGLAAASPTFVGSKSEEGDEGMWDPLAGKDLCKPLTRGSERG